jgi:D-threo-aldose 1-dehydrogenase
MTSVALIAVARSGLNIPSICFGTTALGDMPDTYGYAVEESCARAT